MNYDIFHQLAPFQEKKTHNNMNVLAVVDMSKSKYN